MHPLAMMRQAPAICTLLALATATGAGALVLGSGPSRPPKILYVLRTYHDNYATKMAAILKTWAAPLGNESLLVIGDQPSNVTSVHISSECYNDGESLSQFSSFAHNLGLCCKTAEAIAHAVKERPSWDWLFMADDDHYVMTGNLEKVLAGYDPARVMALGALGCSLNNCSAEYDHFGRMCGGGGYVLSRAGAAALVGESVEGFKKEHHNISTEFLGEEDTSTTCLLRRKGIEIVHLRGTYGWRLAPPHNDENHHQLPYVDHLPETMLAPLYKEDPIALTFHYLSPAEIEAYHRHVTRSREQQSLLSVASRIIRKRRPS